MLDPETCESVEELGAFVEQRKRVLCGRVVACDDSLAAGCAWGRRPVGDGEPDVTRLYASGCL